VRKMLPNPFLSRSLCGMSQVSYCPVLEVRGSSPVDNEKPRIYRTGPGFILDGTIVPFGSALCAENRHIRAIALFCQAGKVFGFVRTLLLQCGFVGHDASQGGRELYRLESRWTALNTTGGK
jgi:hypothetical protein